MPEDTPEAIAQQIANDAVAAFRKSAASAVVFSRSAEAPPGSAMTSQMGGVPSRVGNAEWPVSSETGKPLIFVAQIARDPTNEKLMGDIGLIQIFADIRHFSGELSDDEGITIRTYAGDDVTESGDWDPSLAETTSELIENALGEPLAVVTLYLAGREALIGDSSVLEAAHDALYERWRSKAPYEVLDKAFHDLWKSEPELFLPEDTSVLGGKPMWLQDERTSPLPFFLQIATDGNVMIGDGGHLYVFLDPKQPELGFEIFLQMY